MVAIANDTSGRQVDKSRCNSRTGRAGVAGWCVAYVCVVCVSVVVNAHQILDQIVLL